eukprot:1325569-Amorphochlora_amoeboformis.AAC.2
MDFRYVDSPFRTAFITLFEQFSRTGLSVEMTISASKALEILILGYSHNGFSIPLNLRHSGCRLLMQGGMSCLKPTHMPSFQAVYVDPGCHRKDRLLKCLQQERYKVLEEPNATGYLHIIPFNPVRLYLTSNLCPESDLNTLNTLRLAKVGHFIEGFPEPVWLLQDDPLGMLPLIRQLTRGAILICEDAILPQEDFKRSSSLSERISITKTTFLDKVICCT